VKLLFNIFELNCIRQYLVK